MPHKNSPLRSVAAVYGVVVLLAATWAVIVDVRLLYSQREHLLPDVVLALINFPTSLTVGPLYMCWPEVFGNEFVQVAWAAACGLAQAALLFKIGGSRTKGSNAA